MALGLPEPRCTLACRQNFDLSTSVYALCECCAKVCRHSSFVGELLGIDWLSEPRWHFDARQFYDYSLLGFSLHCATRRNSNIHNPKIGSSCFTKAKHFGAPKCRLASSYLSLNENFCPAS